MRGSQERAALPFACYDDPSAISVPLSEDAIGLSALSRFSCVAHQMFFDNNKL